MLGRIDCAATPAKALRTVEDKTGCFRLCPPPSLDKGRHAVMAFSAYAQQAALSFLLAADDSTRPSSWSLGLCGSPPTDASFIELVNAPYARQPVTFPSAITADLAVSGGPYPFDIVDPAYGFAVFDNATGGNVLFWDGVHGRPPVTRSHLDLGPIKIDVGIAEGRNNVSLFAANALLAFLLQGFGTPPSATYVGLAVDIPDPANNDGKELIDGGYSRQLVSLSSGLPGVAAGEWANAAPFSFGPFAGDVTIIGSGIYDSASGGHLLMGGILGEPLSFSAGQSLTFAPQHLMAALA
jgi:hypothetical protein